MAWYTQVIILIVTLLSAPLGVKLLDAFLASFKKYYNERRDKKNTETANQIELANLRMLKSIDVSKASRDDFQSITDMCLRIADDATKRAHAAEQRAETSEESARIVRMKLDEFEGKFVDVQEVIKSHDLIREQMEIDERLMYDTFNIAYFEVTPDGRVSGNATFLRLTGLAIAKCHQDGWFEAIEESARERCRNFWEAFISNHQTRPAIPFSFRNVQTGDVTHTTVFCGARMKSIVEVYKYTARTKPLLLSPAMTIPDDLPTAPQLQLNA